MGSNRKRKGGGGGGNAHERHTEMLATEEIEMLKVVYCIWFVESGSSNIRARYYSSDDTVESFNQTYIHV
ncbi:MAG: hypothetical protein M3136_11820 [Thermoproteota archaeon]|nr:hypothetical protein [Thermoproteota archaeon]